MKKLIIALCACLILACLSCSNINKATQRVLLDSTARNLVGAKWAELNPCQADSVVTYIKGDTVTFIDSVTVKTIDTTKVKQLIDSLNDLNLTTDVLVALSYESGYKNALKEHPPIFKIRVDTVKTSLKEKRDLNILSQQLAAAKQLTAKKEGIIEQNKTQSKIDGKHKLIMGGVILLLGVIVGILVKIKMF